MTIDLTQYQTIALEGSRSNYVPPEGRHLLKVINYTKDNEKGYEAYDLEIASEKDQGSEFRIFPKLTTGTDGQKQFWGKQITRACLANDIPLSNFTPEKLVNGYAWADVKVGEYNGEPQVSVFFSAESLPAGLSLSEQDPFDNLA